MGKTNQPILKKQIKACMHKVTFAINGDLNSKIKFKV